MILRISYETAYKKEIGLIKTSDNEDEDDMELISQDDIDQLMNSGGSSDEDDSEEDEGVDDEEEGVDDEEDEDDGSDHNF